MPSAKAHPAIVQQFIDIELREGQMFGPFAPKEIQYPVHISRFGVIEKKLCVKWGAPTPVGTSMFIMCKMLRVLHLARLTDFICTCMFRSCVSSGGAPTPASTSMFLMPIIPPRERNNDGISCTRPLLNVIHKGG